MNIFRRSIKELTIKVSSKGNPLNTANAHVQFLHKRYLPKLLRVSTVRWVPLCTRKSGAAGYISNLPRTQSSPA